MELRAYELSYIEQDGGYGRYLVTLGDTYAVVIDTDGDSYLADARKDTISEAFAQREGAKEIPFESLITPAQRRALEVIAGMIW